MKRSTSRTTIGITLAIALAGGLSACGGDEETESAAEQPPAATQAPAEDDGEATQEPAEDETTEDAGAEDATDAEPAPPQDTATDAEPSEPAEDETTEDGDAAPEDGGSGFATNPEDYATAWIQAWGVDDRATLETMTDPTALNQILDQYAGDENWAYREAYTDENDNEVVSFAHNEDGRVLALVLDPAVVAEGGQAGVVNFSMSDPENVGGEGPGFPTDPGAYADELIRLAGEGGDEAALGEYAVDQVAANLSHTNMEGVVWTRAGDPVEEGEGQWRVTYEGDNGETLDLLVDEEIAAAGDLRAVVGITWS